MSQHGLESLSWFQDAFVRALTDPSNAPDAEFAAISGHPAFAVYRNGVMKSALDALQGNYPAIVRLVGEEWFRAAAAVYVRNSPPTVPMLNEYGAGFAAFLESFPPAAEIPYLPDVARLDRMWTEAHIGPDAPVLPAGCIAALKPEDLAASTLIPHPCSRWAWFDSKPVYTIWSRNRAGEQCESGLSWCGEGALISRPAASVTWTPLNAAGCAFLDRCAAGGSVAEAASDALEADAGTDLARMMFDLFEAGAFTLWNTPQS